MKMRTVMAGVILALMLPGGAGGQEMERDFSWEGVLKSGDVLEIKGVNGSVYAEAAPGDRIEVIAEKRGHRSDPERVRIDVVEHRAGITFCAVYPPEGGRENRCRPGEDGALDSRNNDVTVTFRVKVPAGIHFVGRTTNGDVEARELGADVQVRTVNGDVEISTRGVARASTVNGSVRASMGTFPGSHTEEVGSLRLTWDEEMEFRTVNGSIVLDLPDDVGADLDASWVNGSLESELPFKVERMGRREARGILGSGGPRLKITTVNGFIHIR